jgi:hypothetical protein
MKKTTIGRTTVLELTEKFTAVVAGEAARLAQVAVWSGQPAGTISLSFAASRTGDSAGERPDYSKFKVSLMDARMLVEVMEFAITKEELTG